ncbi:Uncharacterised protein [Mycobacteroides abscessus subsp. massiliense]|nr:Uncharacterised protein [Mycobacteroides abscessus subsp. massiliense]
MACSAVAATGTATAIGTEAVTVDVIGAVREIAADKGIAISAAIVTATVPRARAGSARRPPASRRGPARGRVRHLRPGRSWPVATRARCH